MNDQRDSYESFKMRLAIPRALLLLIMFALSIPTFFLSREIFVSFAQTRERTKREVGRTFYPNEPISIVGLKNGKREFQLNERFEQRSDWLKDLGVSVKNESGKTITFIRFGLDFPETTSTGNMMSFPFTLGVSPISANQIENKEVVPSGATVEMTISEKQYRSLRTFLAARHVMDDLSKMDIRLALIVYDDGTGWSNGSPVRKDPDDPKRFIPLDSAAPEKNNER